MTTDLTKMNTIKVYEKQVTEDDGSVSWLLNATAGDLVAEITGPFTVEHHGLNDYGVPNDSLVFGETGMQLIPEGILNALGVREPAQSMAGKGVAKVTLTSEDVNRIWGY